MNNQPFFTIGIPVYNTEKWISECLDSILSQDFTDFEIICVDDGSTDNSLDILNTYAEKDNRIKVITRKNGGVASARNTAIVNSIGEYITFIDSDDVMVESALSKAYNSIKRHNSPDLLHANFISTDGKHSHIIAPQGHSCIFDLNFQNSDERAVYMWLYNLYTVYVFGKFYKRDFLFDHGITFIHRYLSCEDCDFVFHVLRKADTIAYDDFVVCKYINPREGSITTQASVKAFSSSRSFYSSHLYDMKYLNLSDDFKQNHSEKFNEKFMGFLTTSRDGIFEYLNTQNSISKIYEISDILHIYISPHIKQIPTGSGALSARIIYTLFRLIGIKPTVRLLCFYLKLKGILKE